VPVGSTMNAQTRNRRMRAILLTKIILTIAVKKDLLANMPSRKAHDSVFLEYY
jgi:hypothetical protein